MPNIQYSDEELIQDDDKMALEIEKRRTDTEKKIYFALKKILGKSRASLTTEDKLFLKARQSYLTKAEIEEYSDILKEDVSGQAPTPPKFEDMTRTELEVEAHKLGIEEPEKLQNKAAIIEAIRAAQGTEE